MRTVSALSEGRLNLEMVWRPERIVGPRMRGVEEGGGRRMDEMVEVRAVLSCAREEKWNLGLAAVSEERAGQGRRQDALDGGVEVFCGA